jgi:hypothetical protein
MQYTRNQAEPMQELVEDALSTLAKNPHDATAGYSVIRYAQQGLLKTSAGVDANIFVNWYPLNLGFVILRLAQQGKLEYAYQGDQ